MKKDKSEYKELRKLVKEHNLQDYKECNTKEGLHKDSTHSSEPTTGDTDSKIGKLYGDSVMSSKTLYHEGTHTSGADRNDTRPYVPLSDALILYTASDGGTYDSDKDTGYGD